MREIKIPVGISDFKEIREGSYYIFLNRGFPFTKKCTYRLSSCGEREHFYRTE